MLNKTKWLIKETALRIKYITDTDCMFCKIAKGELKTKPIFENEMTIAFNDINPVAETHVLIVPKKHIESVLTITKNDSPWIIDMFQVAERIVTDKKLGAFRLAFNGGSYQHVPHLHMHLLAGGSVKWSKL